MFDTEEYNRWMGEAENTYKSAIVDKENIFIIDVVLNVIKPLNSQ